MKKTRTNLKLYGASACGELATKNVNFWDNNAMRDENRKETRFAASIVNQDSILNNNENWTRENYENN